ncbi:MAG: hypothetical protein ISS15_13235 [Alphaproteobacteria bacterium]|nr:hypothetical protein [Alphaproteobacteria bacterium]MBL7098616.1 hypothetical protein [Alphaproteobacteria bacterium]
MSEIGRTATGTTALRTPRLVMPAAPIARPFNEIVGVVLLIPILLSVAAWNGFPIIFYDTGAYMLQGLGHVFIAERSPIYSAFLEWAGGRYSLWLVAIAQCAITAFVMVEFARAIRPQMSLWVVLAIGAALCVATGLPWYAAQIEPDCFVALVPMAIYLLAFGDLGRTRNVLLCVAAAVSIACHPSHIVLGALLSSAIVAMRLAPMRWIEANGLSQPKIALMLVALAAAMVTVLLANYLFTKHVFFSRSGAIFLEARLMEDGLIKPVLDTDCATRPYAVCRYKDRLPRRADTWLWMADRSPFRHLGGFARRGPEAAILVGESLKRYPLTNLIVALQDGALQFFWFQTGDGIVPQEWVLNREFKIAIPQQVSAYDRAYQQEGEIWFLPFNLVHVPVALLTLAALYLILRRVWRGRDWRGGVLPAFVLLALIGNAMICGALSGPHGRYQSRIMWLPVFAVALVAWPRIEGELRRRLEAKQATI